MIYHFGKGPGFQFNNINRCFFFFSFKMVTGHCRQDAPRCPYLADFTTDFRHRYLSALGRKFGDVFLSRHFLQVIEFM